MIGGRPARPCGGGRRRRVCSVHEDRPGRSTTRGASPKAAAGLRPNATSDVERIAHLHPSCSHLIRVRCRVRRGGIGNANRFQQKTTAEKYFVRPVRKARVRASRRMTGTSPRSRAAWGERQWACPKRRIRTSKRRPRPNRPSRDADAVTGRRAGDPVRRTALSRTGSIITRHRRTGGPRRGTRADRPSARQRHHKGGD